MIVFNISYSQESELKEVLKEGVVGKVVLFNHSSEKDGINKVYISYLGSVITHPDDHLMYSVYKIGPAEAKELNKYVNESFDFETYIYQLDCYTCA